MKRTRSVVRILFLLWISLGVPTYDGDAKSEQAEWGELAAKQTKEEFPDYHLVGFSYVGKHSITDSREQFNYTMSIEKNDEERQVNVYVLSNPKTGEPIDVFFDDL
ncbi:DUF3889 domain-containing protein [Alteribacillus iranensis]|uniref:DUF3889 domain-containing protein n=1 Tax=Alteribacillus iranensis TaxID=930128 RepID=A0A1I2E2B8_9BACI|nr:DUF3889 domain-containing protein [Alteribacillus iranensis]SFE86350.1 Protein of unknown function [Alteribacillus iranensis]